MSNRGEEIWASKNKTYEVLFAWEEDIYLNNIKHR